MESWIDIRGEVIFRIVSIVAEDREPREVVGFLFGGLGVFLALGSIIAIRFLGRRFDLAEWILFVAIQAVCMSGVAFCFWKRKSR